MLSLGKIFKDFIDHWKHDWKTNKVLFWLELIGFSGAILAALLLSFWINAAPFVLIYSLFLIGSGSMLIASYIRRNGFWVLMNLGFILIDINGFINAVI